MSETTHANTSLSASTPAATKKPNVTSPKTREQFYVETFGTDKEAVSVSIVEIPGEEFSETIQQRYRPEELYISSRAVSNDE